MQKSPAIIYSIETSEKILPFRIDRFPWLLHPKCKNGKLGLDQSKTKVKIPNYSYFKKYIRSHSLSTVAICMKDYVLYKGKSNGNSHMLIQEDDVIHN